MKSSKFILFAGVAVCALACLAGVSKFVVYDQSVLVPSGTVGIGTNSTPVRLHVVQDLITNIAVRIDTTNYTPRTQFGILSSSTDYGVLWFGNVTPAANNFTLAGNGSVAVFNGTTSAQFQIANVAQWALTGTALAPSSSNADDLGTITSLVRTGYFNQVTATTIQSTNVVASSVTATNIHGYTITGWSQASLNPAGGTIYFIGGETAVAPGTAFTNAQIRIPKTGVLKSIYVKARMTTAGSSELMTNVFRLNDTTDLGPIIAIGYTAPNMELETNLNHVVTAGDKIALKVFTPTSWSSAPVGVRWYWMAYIE